MMWIMLHENGKDSLLDITSVKRFRPVLKGTGCLAEFLDGESGAYDEAPMDVAMLIQEASAPPIEMEFEPENDDEK